MMMNVNREYWNHIKMKISFVHVWSIVLTVVHVHGMIVAQPLLRLRLLLLPLQLLPLQQQRLLQRLHHLRLRSDLQNLK